MKSISPRLKTLCLSTTLSLGLVAGASAATIIADFVDDFPTVNGTGPQFDGTETLTPGWDYMWNPVADGMGTATNYQSLQLNTVDVGGNAVDDEGLFTNIGNLGFNATGQGDFRYGRIGTGSSHPGQTESNSAIYAYTIQAGEAGIIAITGSSLLMKNATGTNGIDVDVYVNDTLISALSVDGFNTSGTAASGVFDGSLGTLSVGDTVHVAIDNNVGSGNDAFVIDFSLESAPIPEPGSSALVGLAGLLLIRRRR